MPHGMQALSSPTRVEPETPAVEAWRLKPLDRQGSPETLTFKGSLVSGKPSP